MENVLIKLKSACAAKTESAKQEIIFWQKLFEVIEEYLLSRQSPVEQKPADLKSPEPKPSSKSPYLCGRAAAEYLGCSDTTLAKWRCVGGGPRFVKIGRSVRYRTQDLEAFVNDKSFPHTSAYKRK